MSHLMKQIFLSLFSRPQSQLPHWIPVHPPWISCLHPRLQPHSRQTSLSIRPTRLHSHPGACAGQSTPIPSCAFCFACMSPSAMRTTPDSAPRTPRHLPNYMHLTSSAQHHMQTHAKSGIFVPKCHFNLTATTPISPIPHTYRLALKDPNWHNAMTDECNALMTNNTWCLVNRPAAVNVVGDKWIFRIKYHPDGTLSKYKARWVVRGCSQQSGVDYGENFSLVIKPATTRTVLSITTSSSWPIHQLDVKNAFLHDNLSETVYCAQPSGFIDPSKHNHVCKLNKSLYGLKQAPRTWFIRFKVSSCLLAIMHQRLTPPCLSYTLLQPLHIFCCMWMTSYLQPAPLASSSSSSPSCALNLQ